jgi:hypothetical protein
MCSFNCPATAIVLVNSLIFALLDKISNSIQCRNHKNKYISFVLYLNRYFLATAALM